MLARSSSANCARRWPSCSTCSDGGPTVVCLEPCLAFAALPLEGEGVEIRVYLSLEAQPRFVVAGAAGMFENYVPLRTDLPALELAAAEWGADLRAFPARGH